MVISSMLDIMDWCSQFSLERMKLYVNVGIVNTLVLSPLLFLEHFYVFEKHVIYSNTIVVKLVLSNLYNCICLN